MLEYFIFYLLSVFFKIELDEASESPFLNALGGAMNKSGFGYMVNPAKIQKVRVLCVPIPHLLKALGWNHVDFWSLDLNGSDLEALKTFPWEEIDVQVLLTFLLRMKVISALLQDTNRL
jgi:hypothetical protein